MGPRKLYNIVHAVRLYGRCVGGTLTCAGVREVEVPDAAAYFVFTSILPEVPGKRKYKLRKQAPRHTAGGLA